MRYSKKPINVHRRKRSLRKGGNLAESSKELIRSIGEGVGKIRR